MTITPTRTVEVPTPYGPARLHVDGSGPGRCVLGHGAGGGTGDGAGGGTGDGAGGGTGTAGGGVEAPDLVAARDAAVALGLEVVRVEQPWRVRGARVAEAPPRLDVAWLAALDGLEPLPTVLGGRSSGARVACRTAGLLPDVRGVLCLAFPLVPPGSTRSRAAELAGPDVPRLVVQGGRDAFGLPTAGPGTRVVVVAGADHAFAVRRADGRTRDDVLAEVSDVVSGWLREVLPLATAPAAQVQRADRLRR